MLALALASCTLLPGQRRSAGMVGLGNRDREDPALGRGAGLLASLVQRDGRAEVLLQEQPSGRVLPLGPLARGRPHHSPSLSRNGRYLALLIQQGQRSLPVVWDRASGQLHRLPLPPGQEAERLSLSPDGRQLALELWQDGRSRVRLLDLTALLEADPPPGLAVQGPPPAAP